MKRLNVFFAALLCVLMASPAYALNLSQGKSQGLVGERLDGYIGAVSSASPEVQQLVSEVNRARKAEYLKIASQNGQPISVVESVKAAFDIYAPMSGKVTKTNGALETQPELVNQDCYGEGWFFELELSDASQWDALMSAEVYETHIQQEAK